MAFKLEYFLNILTKYIRSLKILINYKNIVFVKLSLFTIYTTDYNECSTI
jgi:hypothetical protein